MSNSGFGKEFDLLLEKAIDEYFSNTEVKGLPANLNIVLIEFLNAYPLKNFHASFALCDTLPEITRHYHIRHGRKSDHISIFICRNKYDTAIYFGSAVKKRLGLKNCTEIEMIFRDDAANGSILRACENLLQTLQLSLNYF